jgi:biotin transporter BioY
MYIVAIAWLYVALMMAITERSVVAGVMTFLFYGLLPCALFVWLAGGRSRRRARERDAAENSVAENEMNEPDRQDAK